MRCFYAILLVLLCAFPSYAGNVYHIDPDWSGTESGTFAQPYNNWTDLPSMSTGDDVYFKCNTTYTAAGQMNITWGGTSGDRAIVGSYYDGGGSPVYGVSGARPVISGSNYTIPNSTSEAAWGGLIRVDSRTTKRDYITIQNLEVLKAGGYGIELLGGKTVATTPQYCIIENSFTNGSSRIGIAVVDTESVNVTIRNNEVYNYAYGWKYLGFGPTWSGGLVFAHCKTANSEVYGNYVHHGWGEGIGNFTFSTVGQGGIKIYNNIVYSSRRIDIYMDGSSNNEVYNNVLIGTDDCVYKGVTILRPDGGCWNQVGIALNAEDYDKTSVMDVANNKVYNNLIVGHLTGLEIGVGPNVQSYDNHTNNKIFNNTFLSNRYNMRADSGLATLITSGNELKDNIFACIDYAAQDGCDNQGGMVASFDNYYDTDYNMWALPLPTNGGGTNDLEARADGWTLTSLNLHDIQEGEIQDVVQFAKKLLGNAGVGSGSQDADQPTTDYFGYTRPSGEKDRGFDQYGAPTQNLPPTITDFTPSSQCVAVDVNVSCTVAATDPDADSLTYSWTDEGVEFSTSEDPGNRSWSSVGTYRIRVDISDGKGGTTYAESTIQVSASCGSTQDVEEVFGNNTTDDYTSVTDDSWITAEAATTAYNTNNLRFEDPSTDDSTQKVLLISFDTTALSGETLTKVILELYREDNGLAFSNTIDAELWDVENNATEAATWTNYDGSNAWTTANSPEGSTQLGNETIDTNDIGWLYFDSTDDADLLTHVNNGLGGRVYFAVMSDSTTAEYIRIVSSEGADGYRPRLRVTYQTEGSEPTPTLNRMEWLTQDGTYGQGDTVTAILRYETPAELDGTLTVVTSATGATFNLTATATATSQQDWVVTGTVPASATTSGAELTISSMSATSGTFDGSTTIPGSPNRVQDTGSIYIDTSSDAGISSTCAVAAGDDTWACVDNGYEYKIGDRPRMKWTFPSAQTYSGGQLANVALTISQDAGADLVFQPTGWGIGTTSWGLEAQPIVSGMSDSNIAAATVNDVVTNYVSGTTVIEDLAGNDLTSTALPQTSIDATNRVRVVGRAGRFRAPGSGRVTFGPIFIGEWVDTTAPNIWADTGTTLTWKD